MVSPSTSYYERAMLRLRQRTRSLRTRCHATMIHVRSTRSKDPFRGTAVLVLVGLLGKGAPAVGAPDATRDEQQRSAELSLRAAALVDPEAPLQVQRGLVLAMSAALPEL